MPTQDKVDAVDAIAADLERHPSYFLVDYRGLSVGQATELRRKLRDSGAQLKVVKNTLALLAMGRLGVEGLEPMMDGPTAIAYCVDDPVAPAKTLQDFAKDTKKLEIKGGWLRESVLSASQVEDLASLPSREELIAKVVGGISAPLYGLANVLTGPMRGLAVALDQIREQKAQEAA